MSKTIKATFRIVTPMFLGDWKQGVEDGMRPPSIKGALRFWWRAINWKNAMEHGGDKDRALMWLHKEEARIFGVSAGIYSKDKKNSDKDLGQGIFLLKITKQPLVNQANIVSDWPNNPPPISGSTYMGFGLTESGDKEKGNLAKHRDAMPENELFSLELRFKRDVSSEDHESICKVVRIFGLLGGLGSRVRRGFGSIALVEINGEKIVYKSENDYTLYVKKIFCDFSFICSETDYPPYTVISSLSKFEIVARDKEARTALEKAGKAYKKHRGQESSLRGEAKLPFGIPLEGVSGNDERRSSPLFFHTHKIEKECIVLAYYLPSIFHPKYENIGHDEYAVVRDFFTKGVQ